MGRLKWRVGVGVMVSMLVGAVAPLVPGAAQEATGALDDAVVRRAWSYLTEDEQAEAMEWLRLEVSVLGTFQVGLVTYVLDATEIDPGFWPEVGERAWFDPKTHAPAQPITRRVLEEGSGKARRMVASVHEVRPPRRLQRAWVYDWATGELRRQPHQDEPARVFENALAGFPPDADVAEALILQVLDTGEERATLTAFEHAYTDRGGSVFPLSLYDAWASGVEIEMPDVDTLGIAHTVLGEHRRWVAPVPTRKQRSLYEAIGTEFSDARRYRGLREALAAAYVNAEPMVYDGYGESLIRFHALWDKHGSLATALAEELPRDGEAWTDYLAAWAKRCGKEPELRDAGVVRSQTLAANAARVRTTLVWVMEQLGAFERTERPRPAPPVEEEQDRERPGDGSDR